MNTPILYLLRELETDPGLTFPPVWGQVFPDGLNCARLVMGAERDLVHPANGVRPHYVSRIVYSAVLFRAGKMFYESRPFEHFFDEPAVLKGMVLFPTCGTLWCHVPLADIFDEPGLKGDGLQFCD